MQNAFTDLSAELSEYVREHRS